LPPTSQKIGWTSGLIFSAVLRTNCRLYLL